LELMTEALGHRLQNKHGLCGNFRSNAVAGQNCDVQKHRRIVQISSRVILSAERKSRHQAAPEFNDSIAQ